MTGPVARALAVLAVGAHTYAIQQQTPPQQPPVFRAGVEIVALDVTVVDRDGKPVVGLKPEDFVVTLSGQVRPVRTLDYATFGAAPASEAAASREISNDVRSAAATSRGGRIVVILIDDLAARPGQGKSLMVAAERMLDTLDLGDLVGLATTSGLGPVMTPTRDRAALLQTLKSRGIVGKNDNTTAPFWFSIPEAILADRHRPPAPPPDELAQAVGRECSVVMPGVDACQSMAMAAARRLYQDTIRRTSSQLSAYRQVIEAMKSAPQPRIVIALSTGIMPDIEGLFDLKRVSQTAAEAGVQFYALTEAGDDVDAGDISGERAKSRREEAAVLTSGVQVLATAAGGEAFRVIGQADRFFKRIIAETSGVYRLGVDAPISTKPDRFLDTKVRVNRDGVTVRSNRHALVKSAAADVVPIDDALRVRLAQGGVAYGVPIALATSLRRERAGDRIEAGVNVQVPATVTGPVVAMFNVVDGAGQTVQAGKKTLPSAAGEDYRFALGIPLAPGAYRLRVAAADGAGNVGSVETTLDAALQRFGPFTVSELFLTWQGAAGPARFLALETLPAEAETLRAGLELYPSSGLPAEAPTVRFAVLGPDGVPVLEESASAVPSGTLLLSSAEIAASRLAPGIYTIRATVSAGGRDLGTITTVVRKGR